MRLSSGSRPTAPAHAAAAGMRGVEGKPSARSETAPERAYTSPARAPFQPLQLSECTTSIAALREPTRYGQAGFLVGWLGGLQDRSIGRSGAASHGALPQSITWPFHQISTGRRATDLQSTILLQRLPRRIVGVILSVPATARDSGAALEHLGVMITSASETATRASVQNQGPGSPTSAAHSALPYGAVALPPYQGLGPARR